MRQNSQRCAARTPELLFRNHDNASAIATIAVVAADFQQSTRKRRVELDIKGSDAPKPLADSRFAYGSLFQTPMVPS